MVLEHRRRHIHHHQQQQQLQNEDHGDNDVSSSSFNKASTLTSINGTYEDYYYSTTTNNVGTPSKQLRHRTPRSTIGSAATIGTPTAATLTSTTTTPPSKQRRTRRRRKRRKGGGSSSSSAYYKSFLPSFFGQSSSNSSSNNNNNEMLWISRFILLVVAAMYSTNYACIKYLESLCLHPPCNRENSDPAEVTFCRFLLSATICLPILYANRRKNMDVIIAGVELGCYMTINYICQAEALELISAAKCAFISSLSVAIVPLITGMIERKRIPTLTITSSIIALVGVAILENLIQLPYITNASSTGGTEEIGGRSSGGGGSIMSSSSSFLLFGVIGKGDLLALGIPFAFGYCVTRIEYYIDKFQHTCPNRVLILTSSQCCTVCVLSFCWLLYDDGVDKHLPHEIWEYMFEFRRGITLLWTGIITTIVAIVLQGVALQTASSNDASLIFSTEPVWGSLFAKWLLQETISMTTYIGGSFILLACILGSFTTTTATPTTETTHGVGATAENDSFLEHHQQQDSAATNQLRPNRQRLKSKMSDISDVSSELLATDDDEDDDDNGSSDTQKAKLSSLLRPICNEKKDIRDDGVGRIDNDKHHISSFV